MTTYINYQEFKTLLSVAETAKYLNCSEQTVRKMIHSNELPAIFFRHRYKIKAEDITRYIDKRKGGECYAWEHRNPDKGRSHGHTENRVKHVL